MSYYPNNPNGQATMANSEPVVIASDQSAVPVSAASLPLPTGAGTSAKQDTIIGHLDGVEALLTTIDGDTGNISTKIDTIAGAVAGTEMQVDVVAALPAGTNNIGDVDVAGGTIASGAADSGNPVKTGGVYNATQPTFTDGQRGDTQIGARGETIVIIKDGVNKASIDTSGADGESNTSSRLNTRTYPSLYNGTTWDRARGDSTNGMLVNLGANNDVTASGDIAHDAADSGNPVKIGGKGLSADPTAVATADRVNALFDLLGKQVVLPYAIPESAVSGAITSSMTGTTSTSLVAAPGSGLRNYITTIIVSNAHATVGTDVIIQDGSGGTTLLTIPAAALYGGAVITLPTPLRQPTTNTAIYCANVTTGASTKVSAVGYKAV